MLAEWEETTMSILKFGLIEIAQCLKSTPERVKIACEQWGIKVWTGTKIPMRSGCRGVLLRSMPAATGSGDHV